MITDPDVTRAVRSWLDDDADRLPEWVLDAVLEKVPSTPQRRPWWPPRRLIDMTSKVQIAAVVATIALVAVVGLQLLPASGGIGGPASTPVPTASPSPAPSPAPSSVATPMALEPIVAAGTTSLTPGTYQVGAPFAVPFTITLPGSGWAAQSLTEGDAGFRSNDGFIGVLVPEAVFPDPCTVGDPVPASTAEEFVAALSAMKGFTAENVREMPVGGRPATSFLLTNTVDTSTGACTRDRMLPMFTFAGNTNGAETNGGLDELFYVLEVDGRTVFVVIDTWPTPEGLAELQSIAANISFD